MGPLRLGRLAPLPGPVGRRRRVDRRGDAGDGARRVVLRTERTWLLEPRHRRVLRPRAHSGPVCSLDSARRTLPADAGARAPAPGTLAVRHHGARGEPHLDPASLRTPALPVAGGTPVRPGWSTDD